VPHVLVDDCLCGVARHRRQIDLQRGQRGRVTVNPAHTVGCRLGARGGIVVKGTRLKVVLEAE